MDEPKMPDNPHNYPVLRIDKIETTFDHYAAFRKAHPLEGTAFLIGGDEVIASPIEETYTLTAKSLGTVHINVTGIKEGLAMNRIPFKMYRCHLDQCWYEYTMETSGVEEAGIERLELGADLERPGIMIVWTPEFDHTTIVDGNHRLCRRWREGMRTFEFAMVILPDIQHFVREDSERDRFSVNISNLMRGTIK